MGKQQNVSNEIRLKFFEIKRESTFLNFHCRFYMQIWQGKLKKKSLTIGKKAF